MLHNTVLAFFNPEGWLEMEAHESDLRGSRGVAVAGAMMVVMGFTNFYQTVKPPILSHSASSLYGH